MRKRGIDNHESHSGKLRLVFMVSYTNHATNCRCRMSSSNGSTLKNYLETHGERAKRICIRKAEEIIASAELPTRYGCRDTSFAASTNSGYVPIQLGQKGKSEPITKVLLHHLMAWYYRREEYGCTFVAIPTTGNSLPPYGQARSLKHVLHRRRLADVDHTSLWKRDVYERSLPSRAA